LAVGLAVVLAVIVELWWIHSQNAIGYETVQVERALVNHFSRFFRADLAPSLPF